MSDPSVGRPRGGRVRRRRDGGLARGARRGTCPRAPRRSGSSRAAPRTSPTCCRYDERDLILRRPPSGVKAKSAHDMSREFTIQSRLAPVFGLVPGMVAFCDDQDVIGSDFYVMERLAGTILRRDLPDGMSLSDDEARTLCTNFLDVLVDLHQVDPSEAGLDDLGRGAGYVARQVGGWSDRFRKVPHRQRRRLRAGDGLARRAAARRRRDHRDPQRLPARQRGARRGRPAAGRSASWTGRWPPSATR